MVEVEFPGGRKHARQARDWEQEQVNNAVTEHGVEAVQDGRFRGGAYAEPPNQHVSDEDTEALRVYANGGKAPPRVGRHQRSQCHTCKAPWFYGHKCGEPCELRGWEERKLVQRGEWEGHQKKERRKRRGSRRRRAAAAAAAAARAGASASTAGAATAVRRRRAWDQRPHRAGSPKAGASRSRPARAARRAGTGRSEAARADRVAEPARFQVSTETHAERRGRSRRHSTGTDGQPHRAGGGAGRVAQVGRGGFLSALGSRVALCARGLRRACADRCGEERGRGRGCLCMSLCCSLPVGPLCEVARCMRKQVRGGRVAAAEGSSRDATPQARACGGGVRLLSSHGSRLSQLLYERPPFPLLTTDT